MEENSQAYVGPGLPDFGAIWRKMIAQLFLKINRA